jgi:hypothetical protein
VRETENLATWGGESGRGWLAAREIPGVGEVGRQNSRFSVFQRADTQISGAGVSYVPEADSRKTYKHIPHFTLLFNYLVIARDQ